MGTVIVPCKSQLLTSKNGTLTFTGAWKRGAPVGSGPAAPGNVATRSPGTLKNGGDVKLLRRVYLATPESRGRKPAHASSTRASAPRRVSCEAFAFQLVAAARTPA